MLIKDSRLSAYKGIREGWQARANKAVSDYKRSPGLAGFFLIDEPSSDSFADIAALRRRIRKNSRRLIGYVNMLPDYVFQTPDDYTEYLESYLFKTQPNILLLRLLSVSRG